MTLKYASIIDVVDPSAIENTKRRRQRRNYKEIQNNFLVDSHRVETHQNYIGATCKEKDAKVRVICNGAHKTYPVPGVLLYLLVIIFHTDIL